MRQKHLFLLLLLSFISQTALASWSHYRINMVCGEVKKVRNGKLLKRLEPNFLGLNAKFVLTTKFIDPVGYVETSSYDDRFDTIPFSSSDMDKTHTYFSLKDKFLKIKGEFKAAVKKAKKEKKPLYACVGSIDVEPFKYKGAHVYYSFDSIENARAQMRAQAVRHL